MRSRSSAYSHRHEPLNWYHKPAAERTRLFVMGDASLTWHTPPDVRLFQICDLELDAGRVCRERS